MNLRDLVPETPTVLTGSETVAEAVKKMVKAKVGAAVIIVNGELHGIFSERDLFNKVVARDLDPRREKVTDHMTSPVHTIKSTAEIEAALKIMRDNHFRHLPIATEDGKIEGILSLRNLLHHIVEKQARELDNLSAYIEAGEVGGG